MAPISQYQVHRISYDNSCRAKEETLFVIARDHTYPDHTITMVDNGARVFVLAEKILSAQQGNALLGKSWKKATLQGKVLSKVANKRARLVKFHLNAQAANPGFNSHS